MRLLIVEDEVKLASIIRRGMRAHGLSTDVAIRGEDALWMAASTRYAAIVLDVMLPGIDGFETCRRLRADGVATPVLMLTARDAVADRVAGLDGGADDYLVKPFAFDELLARVRALARRGGEARPPVLEACGLRLDPAAREVHRGELDPRTATAMAALSSALVRVFSSGALEERLSELEEQLATLTRRGA